MTAEGRRSPRGQHTLAMSPRFLTPEEVASLLRVSPEAVRRLLRRGALPAIRIGRAWRVEEADLQRWIRREAPRTARTAARGANGRGGPCLCGCGGVTIGPAARFLPGHDGKLIHRLMTADGLTFDAAREAVRRLHRPRVQERLF
jgi:excisionase family DNA binding protein